MNQSNNSLNKYRKMLLLSWPNIGNPILTKMASEIKKENEEYSNRCNHGENISR